MSENVITMPGLLKEREAAAYIGLSLATLRRLRQDRKISYVRFGSRLVRYHQRHLDEYTGSGKPAPATLTLESALFSREAIVKSSVCRTQMVCGIYFLLQQGRIVYVGQSKHIPARIRDHHLGAAMPFDRWSFQRCPLRLLTRVEAHYISIFKPRYNIAFRPVEKLNEADLLELAQAQV